MLGILYHGLSTWLVFIAAMLTLAGAGGIQHRSFTALEWTVSLSGRGGPCGDVCGWAAPGLRHSLYIVSSQQSKAMFDICSYVSVYIVCGLMNEVGLVLVVCILMSVFNCLAL